MENSARQNPSFLPSPNTHSANSSTCSSSSSSPRPQLQPHQPITRSDSNNPSPTTFVQADTSSFKQVVQMLTGSSETTLSSKQPPASKNPIPPIKHKKQPGGVGGGGGFKLYERRNSLKNFKISPLLPGFSPHAANGFSPRKQEILSPSMLDFPSLVLSPVTPLIPDPFNRVVGPGCNKYPNNTNNVSSNLDPKAEETAIAEKGFYLHPSPVTAPRENEPRLLPLFPVTSPRVSSGSSSSSNIENH